ncbi:HAD-IIA family hydrolase [Paenibacillus apiarius]|uniref:HAD-IIA family hydrolase n=1 Tax=Paenibacillus apiarius TaxID=46240 RepID=A0ABT4DSG9_9BACL|nr:HAD-IIA family hydrolase [Paenibacillus apiarius]MCY9514136.1 HAD-IIA family hydrolase [Paenibacillus apiarius]MCY9520259.1 HAD-IIA family hydrolase [Paenibacillus apiarius]MCY9550399.1 HAD-IIA family hydrolase [Paenibacillus apiarius]MCY9557461.1 HAD-IIA family hydrolase [Paenibacillus apiarius]MCY9682360.1 HAD-IIA family hydrolase [Paenibacillus apiarius]
MLLDRFDVFLFDLDGVIYIGSEALPGAVQALERLRAERKTIRFLTNNPCMTREQVAAKLNGLGIEAGVGEVVTSGWATAHYLREQQFHSVYVLGDEHLEWECRQAGLELVDVSSAEAVVVGWSDELTLREIQGAVTRIVKGAKCIATNADRIFPGPVGPMMAVGTVVEAIKLSAGISPDVVGKPFPYMFQQALEHVEDLSRAVMVGDTPDADIAGAHRMGISAILVSNAPSSEFPSARDFRKPDAIIPDLRSLWDQEVRLEPWTAPAFPWPDDIKPGVAGIIMDERRRVLLMKRADNGCWGIPSGHVELGETVEEAIVREIAEETGLNVKVTRLIGVYSHPDSQVFSYPNGKVSHFVTTYFRCEVAGGTLVREGDETLDVQYFELDALPGNMLTMHPRWIADALADDSISFFR